MPFQVWPHRHIQLLLALLPVVILLFASYHLKTFYKTVASDKARVKVAHLAGFISDRAWNYNSSEPEDKWYDDDGTPLSYAAWRAKPEPLSPEPTARAAIMQYGARVACWPSTGGVWIKHAVPLELDFLRLDRFSDTQRPWPQVAEQVDGFCLKMRTIGSEFWPLPPDLPNFGCSTLQECVKPQRRGDLGLAWSRLGGAYVLNLTTARTKCGVGLGGYFNARFMMERCDISRSLGGIYCPEEPYTCEAMWCAQYPDHCDEATQLSWVDFYPDLQGQ